MICHAEQGEASQLSLEKGPKGARRAKPKIVVTMCKRGVRKMGEFPGKVM